MAWCFVFRARGVAGLDRFQDRLEDRGEAKEIAERHGYVVQVLHPVAPSLKRRFTLDLRAGRIWLITDGERVTRAWNG